MIVNINSPIVRIAVIVFMLILLTISLYGLREIEDNGDNKATEEVIK